MQTILLFPKYTLIYAGLYGLLYLLLSINVISHRWKDKRGLGFDHDPKSALFRAIRIHGNFMEYIPFLVTLMLLDEITGSNAILLNIIGGSVFVGRISHFVGIRKTHGASIPRAIGVLTTFSAIFILAINLIAKGLL
ncbi:MAG: MAPEG family protein [Bacteriovoracaceae bacterium]